MFIHINTSVTFKDPLALKPKTVIYKFSFLKKHFAYLKYIKVRIYKFTVIHDFISFIIKCNQTRSTFYFDNQLCKLMSIIIIKLPQLHKRYQLI